MKKINLLLLSTLVILFIGCGKNIPTPNERLSNINQIKPQNFISKTIQTSKYKYFTIHNVKQTCKNINIYIEGDGLSWITRNIISSNPTPMTPTAFKLMLQDKSNCSIYLARACQYTNDSLCTKKDWTSHRFSGKIVDSTNEVINKIKGKYKNNTFNMIGYSGGAAIASLVSNKRNDIKILITVAGNLNTTLWTSLKNITPLQGSLNPTAYTQNLNNIRQYHIIGKNDKVIPREVLTSYLNKFLNKDNIKVKSFDATHACCYEDGFSELLSEIAN